MKPRYHRQGTLLILIAGMSAVLVSLTLAFIYSVGAEAQAARATLNQAQARIVFHSALAIISQDAKPLATPPAGTWADAPAFIYVQEDRSTWRIAWMNCTKVAPDYNLVVVGGPTADATADLNLDEYRYRFTVTPDIASGGMTNVQVP